MFGPPAAIGEYVRAVVADEQQITCSVGIGPTKFVAKVASRAAKPDGLVEVTPDRGRRLPAPDAGRGDVGGRPADRGEAAPAGHLHRRRPRPHPAGHAAPDLRAARRCGTDRARLGPRPATGGAAGAGAQRRLAGDLRPGQRRARGGEARAAADGRPDGQPDAQAADARPDGLDLGPVRRLHRADPVGHHADPDRRDRGDLRRRRSGCTTGSGWTGRGSAGSGSGWSSSSRSSRAYRQPRLTDPERGWREADQAVDAAVGKFGSGAVQRAVLARRNASAAPSWSSGILGFR